MEFKVGDLIHITKWFNHGTDHVAEIVEVDANEDISFEPGIVTPIVDDPTGFLSREFFSNCKIEKG